MIKLLDHSHLKGAADIYRLFQRSYLIEAELIGVLEFPPLARTSEDIAKSASEFYGYFDHDSLAGVIEIERDKSSIEIHSLTVDPAHFRKGIANQLIAYAFTLIDQGEARVETATANAPAIALYQKHGFKAFKRWTPDHGIEKLALSVNLPRN